MGEGLGVVNGELGLGLGLGRVENLSGNRYSVFGIRISNDDAPFPMTNSQNI
jgi:hypothetical protein